MDGWMDKINLAYFIKIIHLTSFTTVLKDMNRILAKEFVKI